MACILTIALVGADPVHPTDPRMHQTVCSGRPCRPGEGNLKGYGHWYQPYEDLPIPKELIKTAPHSAVPTGHYAALVKTGWRVQQDKFVVLAVADYDFRELAEVAVAGLELRSSRRSQQQSPDPIV